MPLPRLAKWPEPPKKKKYIEEVELARKVRREKWLQDKRCHYCLRTLDLKEATLDHVKPVSRGGKSVDQNLVIACLRCNRLKGDLIKMVFKKVLKYLIHTKQLPSLEECKPLTHKTARKILEERDLQTIKKRNQNKC